jgi:acyl-coenzyme A thioesterase PaaI-like protein
MQYSHAALQILGYQPRSKDDREFTSLFLPYWYRFDLDYTGNFAWFTNKVHVNNQGTTHGGALLSYMDQTMAMTIKNATGLDPYTVELNTRFIHTARIPRWIFSTVKIVDRSMDITVSCELHANDPKGILVMTGTGKFVLPKPLKMLDDDE